MAVVPVVLNRCSWVHSSLFYLELGIFQPSDKTNERDSKEESKSEVMQTKRERKSESGNEFIHLSSLFFLTQLFR